MAKKKSQCEQILEYLQSGKTLTGAQAYHLFGTMYLPRRIADLKSKGNNIQTEPAGIPDRPDIVKYFMPEHRAVEQKTMFGDTYNVKRY